MITVQIITKAASECLGIAEKEFYGRERCRHISNARQLVMWIAKHSTNLSFPEIGRSLGGRDHTTILHGAGKARARIASDPMTRAEVEGIIAKILNEENDGEGIRRMGIERARAAALAARESLQGIPPRKDAA